MPVPVIFTMHGWDPNTQRVEDWIAARLRETYPLFAGKRGAADAAELVRAGDTVAVILDGLDEIPDDLQPVALQALSEHAVFRVVVLARSAEMAAAAQHAFLAGAIALELHDIEPEAAVDYLTSVQLDPAPAGWGQLTGRLHTVPDSPIAKALSSPLTLTLVRDTYRRGDSVRELLDLMLPVTAFRGKTSKTICSTGCCPPPTHRTLGKVALRTWGSAPSATLLRG